MAAEIDSLEKCIESSGPPRYSNIVEEEDGPAEERATLYHFTESKDDGESAEEETKCCAGGFYDVKVFVFLICLLGTAHGFAVNGINNVNIPMYERRFHLTSTQTGLIVSFYDIISLVMLVVAGYFMTKVHPPRLLGAASLCLSLGCLLMALPHFLTADYQAVDAQPDICYVGGNSTEEICSQDEKSESSYLSNYLYMFLAGQALHGMSGTLLHVVGPAFIDKSVSNKQSPTYISIFFSSILIGPTVGYLFGGWLLTKYVDVPQKPPMDLTPYSPAWVGAWWIGFLIASGLGLLISFPLFTFPKVLPGTEARRKHNVNQAHIFKQTKNKIENNDDDSSTDGGSRMPNFSKALILFAKNPAFLYQCVATASEAFISGGLSTFVTKFLANQFHVDTGYAAVITGLVGVPSTFLGQICGGAVIRKFDLKVKSILKLNIIITMIGMALASGYFVSCDLNDIAGVNHAYDMSSSLTLMDISDMGLTAECNADCRCDTSNYDPVCIDGIEYFTPCHAGCSTELDPQTKMYSNCSCASWAVTNNTEQPERMTAVLGKCDNKCNKLYIFLPIMSLTMFFTFFLMVPSTTVILRSVDDSQTTFAMAVKQAFMRLFGAIPGPLLLGAILDNACTVWQEKCNEEGSCWIYNNALMGRSLFFMVVIGKLVSLIALGVAYKLYVPPPTTTQENGRNETKV